LYCSVLQLCTCTCPRFSQEAKTLFVNGVSRPSEAAKCSSYALQSQTRKAQHQAALTTKEGRTESLPVPVLA
jgi:hypothetical protein